MRRLNLAMFVALSCLASAPCLRAQGEIIAFDAPGAGTGRGQGTLPQQITSAGTIVGNIVDTNYVSHGFVRSAQGEFTTIDVPDALRKLLLHVDIRTTMNLYTQALAKEPRNESIGHCCTRGVREHVLSIT